MLFQDYTAEGPVYWTLDGVDCKAKPNIVSTVFGRRYIADLKTTESVNPEAIRKPIAKWSYHRQAAWYLSGMEAIGQPCDAFIFIFVEKAFPHLVTMCQLAENALAKGIEGELTRWDPLLEDIEIELIAHEKQRAKAETCGYYAIVSA